jgi:Protein of unknown function (DUF3631)
MAIGRGARRIALRRPGLGPDGAKEADHCAHSLLESIQASGQDEQGTDRLSTLDLVKALIALETDNPWAPWWEKDVANNNVKGAGTNLSRKIKRFGIKSRVIRTSEDSTPHGFYRTDFEDVWARYCPHFNATPRKGRNNAT